MMSWQNPPNRSAEYRGRADEARAEAALAEDVAAKNTWLETANTWERMAAYEDRNNPPHVAPPR